MKRRTIGILTLCAVLASMMRVAGLVHSPTASRAAWSGRHRKAMSAALRQRARSSGSWRLSASIVISSMPPRLSSRWRILRPVVPSWPSTYILVIYPSSRAKIWIFIRFACPRDVAGRTHARAASVLPGLRFRPKRAGFGSRMAAAVSPGKGVPAAVRQRHPSIQMPSPGSPRAISAACEAPGIRVCQSA